MYLKPENLDVINKTLMEAQHNIDCVLNQETQRRQYRIRRAIAFLQLALSNCENFESGTK